MRQATCLLLFSTQNSRTRFVLANGEQFENVSSLCQTVSSVFIMCVRFVRASVTDWISYTQLNGINMPVFEQFERRHNYVPRSIRMDKMFTDVSASFRDYYLCTSFRSWNATDGISAGALHYVFRCKCTLALVLCIMLNMVLEFLFHSFSSFVVCCCRCWKIFALYCEDNDRMNEWIHTVAHTHTHSPFCTTVSMDIKHDVKEESTEKWNRKWAANTSTKAISL